MLLPSGPLRNHCSKAMLLRGEDRKTPNARGTLAKNQQRVAFLTVERNMIFYIGVSRKIRKHQESVIWASGLITPVVMGPRELGVSSTLATREHGRGSIAGALVLIHSSKTGVKGACPLGCLPHPEGEWGSPSQLSLSS